MPIFCPLLDLIISTKRLRVSEEPAYKSSRSLSMCKPSEGPGPDKRLEPKGVQRWWDGRERWEWEKGGGAVRMDFKKFFLPFLLAGWQANLGLWHLETLAGASRVWSAVNTPLSASWPLSSPFRSPTLLPSWSTSRRNSERSPSPLCRSSGTWGEQRVNGSRTS